MSSQLDNPTILTTWVEGQQAADLTRKSQGQRPSFVPAFSQDKDGNVSTMTGQQFKFVPSRLPGQVRNSEG